MRTDVLAVLQIGNGLSARAHGSRHVSLAFAECFALVSEHAPEGLAVLCTSNPFHAPCCRRHLICLFCQTLIPFNVQLFGKTYILSCACSCTQTDSPHTNSHSTTSPRRSKPEAGLWLRVWLWVQLTGLAGNERERLLQRLVSYARHLCQLAQLAQQRVLQGLANAPHGIKAQARLLGNGRVRQLQERCLEFVKKVDCRGSLNFFNCRDYLKLIASSA